jgi:hypothetical protein
MERITTPKMGLPSGHNGTSPINGGFGGKVRYSIAMFDCRRVEASYFGGKRWISFPVKNRSTFHSDFYPESAI